MPTSIRKAGSMLGLQPLIFRIYNLRNDVLLIYQEDLDNIFASASSAKNHSTWLIVLNQNQIDSNSVHTISFGDQKCFTHDISLQLKLHAYFCPMIEPAGDEHFMKQALREAQTSYDAGEIPVGAVVVADGRIIARAHNLTERLNDVTAHAEMQAITAAADFLGGKYLRQCTLYVTLEPCPMCAGALAWAQIGKVVFGAYDAKKGFTLFGESLLHPKTKWQGGLLAETSAQLLSTFFAERRKDV